VKYVLLYESAPDAAERAVEHFDAHRAHWQRFLEDATLLMIGPFRPSGDGAMSVFRTREAAEDFARGDPFVREGVVTSWTVHDWFEVLVPEE
jgi:uncharacterized protein YciI